MSGRKVDVASTSSQRGQPDRVSVFSRLGTKGGGSTTSSLIQKASLSGDRASSGAGLTNYCRQWAEFGHCSYGAKCKYACTHTLVSPSKRHSEADGRGRKDQPMSKKKRPSSSVTATGSIKDDSPGFDPDWTNWDEKNLDFDDELMLEKKRQLLERELAKQIAEEENRKAALKKGKLVNVSKKSSVTSVVSNTSASSSTSSSSSASESSTSSSESSSECSTESLRNAARAVPLMDKIQRTKMEAGPSRRSDVTLKKAAKPVGGVKALRKRAASSTSKGQIAEVLKSRLEGGSEKKRRKKARSGVKGAGSPSKKRALAASTEELQMSVEPKASLVAAAAANPIRKGSERDKFGFYHAIIPSTAGDRHRAVRTKKRRGPGRAAGNQSWSAPAPAPDAADWHCSSNHRHAQASRNKSTKTIPADCGSANTRVKRSLSSDRRSVNEISGGRRRPSHSPAPTHRRRSSPLLLPTSVHGSKSYLSLERSGKLPSRDPGRRSRVSTAEQRGVSGKHSLPSAAAAAASTTAAGDRYERDRRAPPSSSSASRTEHWDPHHDKYDRLRDRDRYAAGMAKDDSQKRDGWMVSRERSPGYRAETLSRRSKPGIPVSGSNAVRVDTRDSTWSGERSRDDRSGMVPRGRLSRERSHSRDSFSRERSPRDKLYLQTQPLSRAAAQGPYGRDREARMKGGQRDDRSLHHTTANKHWEHELTDDVHKKDHEAKSPLSVSGCSQGQPTDKEAFSDLEIGASDEEILNKGHSNDLEEEGQLQTSNDTMQDGEPDEAEEGETNSRSSSSGGKSGDAMVGLDGVMTAVSDHQESRDNDLLEGISDEDLDVSADEVECKSQSRIADALGVDWSQLVKLKMREDELPSTTPAEAESGKRWSVVAIFNRIGLSKKYLGDEASFAEAIDLINTSADRGQDQLELLHDVAGFHTTLKSDRERRCDLSGCWDGFPLSAASIEPHDLGVVDRSSSLDDEWVPFHQEMWA